jgi:phage gp16-like protein
MTKVATPVAALDVNRKRELALIHMGKTFLARQAGMTPADYDADYREMLQMKAGASSAADLDAKGREIVLRHMKAMGFRVIAAPGKAAPLRKPLPDPMCKKLRAMWYALAEAEVVQRPVNAVACDDAVEAWGKRQINEGNAWRELGRLDALRFGSTEQLSKLIEEMKKWGLRVKARID